VVGDNHATAGLELSSSELKPQTAICGSFFRHAHQHLYGNPTARQRVDRSSPFYHRSTNPLRESHSAAACGSFKSFLSGAPTRIRANPTARQPVDRSSPFYHRSTNPVCARIPQRGSVWIVQVLSTESRIFRPARFAREKIWSAVYREDLKNPHAAALWDSRAYGVGAPMVERT